MLLILLPMGFSLGRLENCFEWQSAILCPINKLVRRTGFTCDEFVLQNFMIGYALIAVVLKTSVNKLYQFAARLAVLRIPILAVVRLLKDLILVDSGVWKLPSLEFEK